MVLIFWTRNKICEDKVEKVFFEFCLGSGTVKWLGEEALKRYQRLRGNFAQPGRKEAVSDVRKTRGGAILDPHDLIREVLDDNDFVSVGKRWTLKKSNKIIFKKYYYSKFT